MKEFSATCRTQRQSVSLFFGIVLSVFCHSVAAQTTPSVDTIAPIIELEELVEGVADSSQVFTVQIAEETALQNATLYYRRAGQQAYRTAPMSALGSSGFFTVSILTDSLDLRPIEYYIQAIDTSGNRTVSGFAFNPYTRNLAPAPAAQSEAQRNSATPTASQQQPSSTATGPTPFYQQRWFQITLGVLAAGALAAAVSSGDDDVDLADVTIILE